MATRKKLPDEEDDVQVGVSQARAALFLLQQLQSGDLRYLRAGVIVLGENRHIPASKEDLELAHWLTEMVVDSLEGALGDIETAHGKVRDGKAVA